MFCFFLLLLFFFLYFFFSLLSISFISFFNDPATTEISPLSLHDALPISSVSQAVASSPARSMAAAGWLTAPSPLRGFVGHGAADPRLHHARRPPDLSVRGSTDELVWGYRYDRFVYALMTGHADSVPTALDAATDRMDLKENADLGRSLEALPLDRRVRALAACRVG